MNTQPTKTWPQNVTLYRFNRHVLVSDCIYLVLLLVLCKVTVLECNIFTPLPSTRCGALHEGIRDIHTMWGSAIPPWLLLGYSHRIENFKGCVLRHCCMSVWLMWSTRHIDLTRSATASSVKHKINFSHCIPAAPLFSEMSQWDANGGESVFLCLHQQTLCV